MKKISIIGGGIAGLASAARLQHKGYQVTIFEKNEDVGGRMSQISGGGFKFDLGPTIIMMPEIYRAVFKDCGKNPDDYIPMKQLENLYDLYFHDKIIQFPSDLAKLNQLLEAVDEQSVAGFYRYLSDIYHRYTIAKDYFLQRSFRSPWDFYNPKMLYQALRLRTFDSADHLIKRYVKNDYIQKMLAFQTLYIGISPYQGPSIYSIIPMIEMLYGVWFMDGGMRRMAEEMKRLCLELGVIIKCDENVEEIVIENQKAIGIKSNANFYESDIVLNTSDFPYAITNLVKETKARGKYQTKKIEKMTYACSAVLIYLGLKRSLKDKIALHNVIFAKDFDKNINDIFNGEFPEDPSVYVYSASTVDSTLAPEHQDGIYILTPVPELKVGKINWDDNDQLEHIKSVIFKTIERIPSLKDIESDIVFEKIITPKDLKEIFNAQYGAAFGLKPTLLQSNYFRPQSTLKSCENLYFAGASNHPGAGVPIVLTSAKIVVEDILNDD